MCTAVAFRVKDHYFGRNLDLERSFDERVTVVPRGFPLRFRRAGVLERHYALIGMAVVADGCPLFFDAVNEKGLGIAGLNFPDFAEYGPETVGKDNVAPFELPLWLLGQCADVGEARVLLDRISVAKINFSEKLPLTPLHWMLADRNGSMVIESTSKGLGVYDNPADVLTNSPSFDMQLFNLNNHMRLSAGMPKNNFSGRLELKPYSLGMGALGLPGDLSSMSRFVRAAFAQKNSRCEGDEMSAVAQFFHILNFVAQPRGLAKTQSGEYEITRYSSCCNADRGIYYYTTYENSMISAVDLHRENLDGAELITYPLKVNAQIHIQNEKG